ncbi:MAG: NADH-quinone oxidoreductase subunit N [Pseudomonadota bacterium]
MIDWTPVFLTLAPELWLAAAGLLGVLAGAVVGDRFNSASFGLGALVLFGAAGLSVLHYQGGEAFDGLVKTAPFVNFAKALSFAFAGVALILGEGFLRRHGTIRYEYALLVVFASLGMGMILSAADLMTLYMGVETLSLSSYVLASFHRDSARSAEAGLKYFVLGALASGLLLYGASLVYGFSGSTRFEAIAGAEMGIGLLFGMVLMITGLAFKVSAAPMHVWTPDVYEGAPTPVVAFFATAPKVAGMVVFANVMFTAYGPALDDWQAVLAIIAGASMLIGAFGALTQTNIKRLLGYSSIANIGYALIGIAAGPALGAGPLLLFMTAYAIASLGLFAGVLAMRRKGGMVEDIQELSGLVRTQTGLAIALTILIVSVSGFPLAVGFFGKLAVLEAGWQAGLLPLVIILILSSVIAFGYYLRLILIMWVNEPRDAFERVDGSVMLVVGLTAALCLALFVFIGPLGELTQQAAASLLR